MSIHSVSAIGNYRKTNEDKHFVETNIKNKDPKKAPVNVYGVFDGHGGKFVSKFLYENLPKCFLDRRVEYPIKKSFVKELFTHYQDVLREKYYTNSVNTGSTCLLAIQSKKDNIDHLNVINTGDSRCVLCSRSNVAVPLTKDAKPNYPEELARIKQAGGDIYFDGYDWRVKDLSVSRAFGDLSAEPYVTNLPDFHEYKLHPKDKFYILACDGLWDVMSNQDVVNFVIDNCYDIVNNVRINKEINIAKKLADKAIALGSTDNITIIVVFLK